MALSCRRVVYLALSVTIQISAEDSTNANFFADQATKYSVAAERGRQGGYHPRRHLVGSAIQDSKIKKNMKYWPNCVLLSRHVSHGHHRVRHITMDRGTLALRGGTESLTHEAQSLAPPLPCLYYVDYSTGAVCMHDEVVGASSRLKPTYDGLVH